MNYSIIKDSGVQAYIQLYNHFVQDIVAGVYPYGSRLPSKRIIAEETGLPLTQITKNGGGSYLLAGTLESFFTEGPDHE